MVRVTHEKVPEGSYLLRVFHDGDVPYESNIETVLLLRDCGDGVCEAEGAHGNLYNEANIEIGKKAYFLGFSMLTFKTLKTSRATHFAKLVREDGHYRYYEANLKELVPLLLNGDLE